MAEIIQPGVLKTPKPKRKFKVTDIVIFLVLVVVIIALLVTLLGKLRLKHEVSSARVVSDRLISDISKKDTNNARGLGDAKFQAKNSNAQLAALFDSIVTTAPGKPKVDRQIVSNANHTKGVYVIYKYGNKTPYYIRVAVSRTDRANKWQLVGISGDSSETALIVK